MKKTSYILILSLILSIKSIAQDSLQIALNKLKGESKMATTLVLVTKNNQETFSSINNFSSDVKYDKSTPFFIGSISKMFTSVTILKLVEQKKLKLNTALSSFMFSKKLPKNISHKITIENLLQHTSGIADFADTILDKSYPEAYLDDLSFINPSFIISTDYILSKLINKTEFEPGSKCSYSNTNYFLLAQVIQEIMDMPYNEAIRVSIISPLQLNDTKPYLSKNINNLMGSFDDYNNDLSKLNFLQYNNICEGSGNITSSLSDLTSFFKALFIEKKLLKDSTLKLMLDFISLNEYGDEMGYGVIRTNQLGISFIGHQGDILANQANIFYNKESNWHIRTYYN